MAQIPNSKNEKDEKLEFLQRQEIRTMRKDISRLREIEAQKEKEKIAALKFKKIEKQEKEKTGEPEHEPPVKLQPGTLIPKPLSKEPFRFKKVLIRGVFIAVFLLIVGFLYWSFASEKQTAEEIIPLAEEEIIPIEEQIEEKKEIYIYASLIPVEETEIIEISQNEEISNAFNVLMEKKSLNNSFTRVVIKNTRANRLSSLEDIVEAFQIETPEGIFQKLEQDYFLALYSQEQGSQRDEFLLHPSLRSGKRIVFAAKIKEKNGLDESLKIWEDKIEKQGIFVSGKKIPALVPYFKQASYKEIDFRYQTLSKDGFGICYSFLPLKNLFILTTSGESMIKIIDKLL